MIQTTAAPFLERLRSETSAAHKNLENVPVSVTILKPEVSRSEYAAYLKLMHEVVYSLENFIYPAISGIVTDLVERKKSGHLKADLEILGSEINANPKNIFGEKSFSEAFALGIAYVVEGSTLGGRFILKNIQQALGYDENSGAAYFGGYGNKTGSMWKSFLQQMTDYAVNSESEDEIINGANFAFLAIQKHLTTA